MSCEYVDFLYTRMLIEATLALLLVFGILGFIVYLILNKDRL